jgi:hypothetical protein
MRQIVPASLVASAIVAVLATSGCKKSSDVASGGDGGSSSSSVLATVASALGLGFEGDVTMHVSSSHSPPEDLTFHVKGQKMRVDVPATHGEQAHALFDQSTNKITVIMDTQKMYMEIDPGAAQAQAQAGGAHETAKITETGKHETVAGTDCEDWDITEASGKHASVCIAKGIAFFDFGGGMRPGGTMSTTAWIEELRAKKAFPLKAVETDATGKELSRMEVTKIEKKSLDDSLFAIPTGYRSMSSMIPNFPHGPKPH